MELIADSNDSRSALVEGKRLCATYTFIITTLARITGTATVNPSEGFEKHFSVYPQISFYVVSEACTDKANNSRRPPRSSQNALSRVPSRPFPRHVTTHYGVKFYLPRRLMTLHSTPPATMFPSMQGQKQQRKIFNERVHHSRRGTNAPIIRDTCSLT